MLQSCEFVYCEVKGGYEDVMLETVEGFNLVLLQIKLFEIDKGVETRQILNKVALTGYKSQLSQFL